MPTATPWCNGTKKARAGQGAAESCHTASPVKPKPVLWPAPSGMLRSTCWLTLPALYFVALGYRLQPLGGSETGNSQEPRLEIPSVGGSRSCHQHLPAVRSRLLEAAMLIAALV